MSVSYIKNILTFLQTDPELESFIKNYENNETGFMFSRDPRLEIIMDAVIDDGHTGASFACTLRSCQSILRGICTLEDYIEFQAEQEKIWKEIQEKYQAEQQQAEQQQAEQQHQSQNEKTNEGEYTYYT